MSDAASDLSEFVRQWGTEALEHPNCGLCGGDYRPQLAEEHFARYVFGIVECTSCGFAYTCPRLTPTLREQLHTPRLRNALVHPGICLPWLRRLGSCSPQQSEHSVASWRKECQPSSS